MSFKKVLPLIIAGAVMLFAGAAWADVPAPPVNQLYGFDDKVFSDLDEAECRVCHGSSTADRHHMLYGSDMPEGECSENIGNCIGSDNACVEDADCTDPADNGTCLDNPEGPCFVTADCATPLNLCTRGEACPVGTCEDDPGISCQLDEDCPTGVCIADPCPSYHGTPGVCGQPECQGGTPAPNNPSAGVYSCLACHDQDDSGGVISFVVTRDCNECHTHSSGLPTPHHLDEAGIKAKDGKCVICHGDKVDDIGDGHAIPTYDPTMVTPSRSSHEKGCEDSGNDGEACVTDADCDNSTTEAVCSEGEGPAAPGGCNYCHDAGTDSLSGVEVVNQYGTHHGSGVYKDRFGNSDRDMCAWCHSSPRVDEQIRVCENCHGFESLHNIQVDSPNPANIGSIIVGAEDGGYGHIGANNPGTDDDDCFGCHGFAIASVRPATPTVPSLSSCDTESIVGGANAVINLTGASFTNDAYVSDVALTAADGSSVTLTPDSISVGAIAVTIPGTTAPGIYEVRVAKADVSSNPIVITVVPAVVITSTSCEGETMTINGTGFGGSPPAGTEEFINVMIDGVGAEIVTWAETQIIVSVPDCGPATVNALLGSAGDGACAACVADCNNDGGVNILDLLIMKTQYGLRDCANCAADLNGDGGVGILDLLIMKTEYSKRNCCI